MNVIAKGAAMQMFKNDLFSQWLGISIINVGPGTCTLEMLVRPDMCNGFEIAHGGVIFSLADSALAFASNEHGPRALSINASISYTHKALPGHLLRAVVTEVSLTKHIGVYSIAVSTDAGKLIASFNGTVYRKD